MAPVKITVMGNLLVDKIKMIDSYPQQTMLCNIRSVGQGIGGCACNTAASAKLLLPDARVDVVGMVGTDPDGDWLLARLKGLGLEVAGVRRTAEQPTSFTDVFTVESTGVRTFFHARGANALLDETSLDVGALDCGVFHIGYALLLDALDAPDPEYGTRMARLLAAVQARGIKTSMDLVSETGNRFRKVAAPSLPYCDYLVINETEGGLLAGVEPRQADGGLDTAALRRICTLLLEMGVRDCVVVHSPEASCCMGRDGRFDLVGSLELPKEAVKGTVGAGDTFCAAVLACFAQGLDWEYALRAASCAAACNLSEANSTDGLRPLEQAMELERLYPRRRMS